jgi:hypothetical protein
MNRAQKQQLRLYEHFRGREMSVFALFRFNWRLYAGILVLGAVSITVMVYLQQPLYAWAFGFVYLVILVRDAGSFRRSSKTWPMVRDVLDWSKIEGLLPRKGTHVNAGSQS